jgi:hypothetical protein
VSDVTCPVCFGEGSFDFRGDDMLLLLVLGEDRIAELVRAGKLRWPLGVIPCDECEGRCVVDEDRARDLHAAAVAQVDQVIAEYNAGRGRPRPDFDPKIDYPERYDTGI